MIRALQANDIVCLLCDRDLAGDGVEVEFFGERTTLPGGPATLALRTGAPLLPAAVYFTASDGHHGVVRPPSTPSAQRRLRDDVARITQDLADELEVLIRRAPEQWHLFQPNWPSDRRRATLPATGEVPRRADADRHGLPVQPHRPRRRAGAGARPGRSLRPRATTPGSSARATARRPTAG